ncbi:MAG: IS1634 family transposase [Kiritimatiellae bacterium]|nr:IS1634 family transposase [Kiritimatiellia bacterium]
MINIILDFAELIEYNKAMYIDIVPNRNSPPAILLRETHRAGKRTVKRTIANLSECPPEAIDALRLTLKGIKLVPAQDAFAVERSLPHGHVEAVLGSMRALGIERMLSPRPCRERDLAVAMIAQRLVDPCSKLATVRQWQATTLATQLGVEDADENDLYRALDWLLARQERIEDKLAARHLAEGARVLYDVSSTTYHGHSCPLAMRGHNRDEEDLPCIVWGLLADAQGRPVAVETYAGNTADPTTVADQVEKLRDRFGLEHVVLVGDRGMLTQARIDDLREHPHLGWISALRTEDIQALAKQGAVQLSLFDTQNLAEITHATFPGERLMVCYNPLLAEDRRRTRNELLDATERLLTPKVAEVKRRTQKPLSAAEIGVKVGRVINHFKIAKYFKLDIQDNHFAFTRDTERIARDERVDGIYIIRTSEPVEDISAADTVRTYKSLGQVEQAFRCLKRLDLRVRPIHHRTPDHVKAHIFLCMMAYYVEWHMRKTLAPVLFQDEELDDDRWKRDPVAKAQPSQTAQHKKRTKQTPDRWPVHSLQSLLKDLATRCQNSCRAGEGKNVARFTTITEPTDFQRHVFELLGIKVT